MPTCRSFRTTGPRSRRSKASTRSAGAKTTAETSAAPEPGANAAPPAPPPRAKASWGFVAGIEIVPGVRAARSFGGGNLFEVFLAWDERRLCQVVCKLPRPDQAGNAEALRVLQREGNLLSRLAHPVIVRSLSVRPVGARPHLILEHVDALTLRRRLRRGGPLPAVRAAALGLHLGAALHYLAAKSVAHLDLKPANVMLGNPPRLIDFSLARPFERAARISRPVGTAAYMAPELCEPGKRGQIGAPADMWGLGLTLYEALGGRAAFPPASEAVPHPQINGEPLPLQGNPPPALADLVMRCLRPDPAARPTAAQFVAELKPVAEALAPRP